MHSAKGIGQSEILVNGIPLFRATLCAMPYALAEFRCSRS